MSQQSAPPQQTLHIHPSQALHFAQALLEAQNVPSAHASIVAECLVHADLHGHDTHGINRLVPYFTRLRKGLISPTATPTLTNITPVVAQCDACNAFGFIAARMAMSKAIEIATVYGIGMVSVKHSNHFGTSATFVQQALDAEMMSLVFTNSSPAMPAWGGREKLLGVSPIAAGAPGGGEGTRPFLMDMAPSVVARGKVHRAARRGETIPEGWALDREGKGTTDPEKALDGGVMLPMAGPKGSALSIMMDVFSGVLGGSAFAGGVEGPYESSRVADVGHLFVVIKPDLFMGLGEFKERMGELYKKIVGSEKMEGCERIYFPGEIEAERAKERERTGIPFSQSEIDKLNEEARAVGVDELKMLERPAR
ncbi:MAG: hypothetical protein Q9227_003368 [Pyrenula ochraceoflavens]